MATLKWTRLPRVHTLSRLASTSSTPPRAASAWPATPAPTPSRRPKPAWLTELESRPPKTPTPTPTLARAEDARVQVRRQQAVLRMLRAAPAVEGAASGSSDEIGRRVVEAEARLEEARMAVESIETRENVKASPVESAATTPQTTVLPKPHDVAEQGTYRPFPDSPAIPLDQAVLFRSTLKFQKASETLQAVSIFVLPIFVAISTPAVVWATDTLGWTGFTSRFIVATVVAFTAIGAYSGYRNVFRSVSYLTVPLGTTTLTRSTPLTIWPNAHKVKFVGHSFPPVTVRASDVHLEGRLTPRKRRPGAGVTKVDWLVRLSPVAKPYWHLYATTGVWGEGLDMPATKAKAELEDVLANEDAGSSKRDFLQFDLSEGPRYNLGVFLTRTLAKVPFLGRWLFPPRHGPDSAL